METITVQNIVAKKTGAKNGKTWVITEVTTSDGRKFDSFDSFSIGETVEVEVTPNAKNPTYNANIRKPKSSGQANAATFKNAEVANKVIEANQAKDERISMLSCISSAANFYQQREANEEKVMNFAKRLFDLATKRVDDLPFVIAILFFF